MSVALLLICIAGQEPTNFGPYGVGSTTLILVDEVRNRRLATEVWYPARIEELPVPVVYSSGAVSLAGREAPPAEGRFPLVVFSHGLASVREQSTFLTEFLASHGYIVAAPDHQHNTGRDLKPFGIYQSAKDRPGDVGFVIEQMLVRASTPSDPLHEKIEKKVAVTGHSLGGYTALAAGGALVEAKPLTNGGSTEPLDFSLPMVSAVVAFMPVCEPFFKPAGLKRLKRPALIVAGGDDRVTPYEKNQRLIFENVQAPKALALIEGATHFHLLNEEMIRRANMIVRAMHKPEISREWADAFIRELTLAFLDEQLKDAENVDWNGFSQPGVRFFNQLGTDVH